MAIIQGNFGPPNRMPDSEKFAKKAGIDQNQQITRAQDSLNKLKTAIEYLRKSGFITFRPALSLLLRLNGEPYSLADHSPFEILFRRQMARKLAIKAGRQVGKSTFLAARGFARCACTPNFKQLFITPLFEQIRRFSNNYVRQFIEQSPVKHLLRSKEAAGSVLQREFYNNSMMIFSFAYLNPDRARGIASDEIDFDEVQDFDRTFIPIIKEALSHSKLGGAEVYSFTPKTLDNTGEVIWKDTSQSEWVVRCGCGYWNWPCLDGDLDKMIGPWKKSIGSDRPGTVCAKCSRPIFPEQDGRWVHRYDQKKFEFLGLHIPQIVLPLHYADSEKWAALLGKQAGAGNTSLNTFYNEVCGESYDYGAKLITITDLKAAAQGVGPNTKENALKVKKRYVHRVLGIDWGGGGEKETSFTTYAAVGMLPNGTLECFYGHRSLTPHDPLREAALAKDIMERLECSYVAHDYSGAGTIRETLLIQGGIPMKYVIPFAYQALLAAAPVTYHEPSEIRPRGYYSLDKSRSLAMLCHCIKANHLRFFDYDHVSQDQEGLLHDFLGLTENKMETKSGKDIYTIHRLQGQKDDFAHSVNYACCAIWHRTQRWPNLAAMSKFAIDPEIASRMWPRVSEDWD